MKSRYTFDEEFSSLSGIPGVFYPAPDDANAPEGVNPASVLDRYRSPDESVGAPNDFADGELRDPVVSDELDLSVVARIGGGQNDRTRTGTIDNWLEQELGLDIARITEEVLGSSRERERVAAAVADLGTDALGCYLPWHEFAKSRKTPWGIYLFLENLLAWSGCLMATASRLGTPLPPRLAIQVAFHVAYRHELFHFHVERFATRQEVLQRRPIYRPYDLQVFRDPHVLGTPAWLEEALAQAVVLESRTLRHRTGLASSTLRPMLEDEFDRFGPGYRDYRCSLFGGPDNAHRVLAAQIATQQVNPPFASTALALPKLEYSADDRIVPGYLTWRPSFVSRFQLGTPPMRKLRTWAQRNGFTFVGPGPGDHERWRHDASGEIVQFNPDGKDSDIASLKAIARRTGQNLRQLVDAIRSI